MAVLASFANRRVVRLAGLVGAGAMVFAVVITHLFDRSLVSAQSNTISINGHDSLALGLQDVYTVVLSDPAGPSGVTVTLDSNDANCVLARTPNETGTGASIDVFVPSGRRRAAFIAQTVSGAAGTCDISATAPSWVTGDASINIVQGKLRLRDLAHHLGALSDNDPFFVEVGVPTAEGEHLRYVQGRSKQFPDLDVTVCSDAPTVGTIVNVFGQDTGGDGCEDNPIIAPFSRTVPGEFQFQPGTGSATPVTVLASATGFISDDRSVTVASLAVTANGPEELGAGLQDSYTVRLSAAAPSNQTVTISVPDTTYCVVAETEQSLGKVSIQRTILAGRYREEFVVQGVATTAAGGPCVVTVDAGTFGTDTIEIEVKDPALRLRQLPSTIGQFASNAGFFVDLGVPDPGNHGLRFVQQVRAGTDPTPNTAVTVTVTSDAPTVGTIVNASNVDVGNDGAESADVAPGFSRTVPNSLKFDPITGSSTPVHVTASAPGFIIIDESEKDVTVKAAALRLSGPEELGSWLQDDYQVDLLAASGHPAATITITSLTPTTCLVSPNPSTAGSTSITRSIASGDSSATFAVHAAEMVADVDCNIEATASGYETAGLHITIRVPGIRIRQLARNFAVDSPNDPFVVEVGLPNTNGKDLQRVQKVRQGSTVPFDVCSSDKTVGTIVDKFNTDNGNDGCESDTVLSTFSNNVPGDLKFDPLAVGSTTVMVYAVGFATVGTGVVDIKVGGDSITLGVPSTIGSGLQESASVRLSTLAPSGGVVVTLASQTTDKCLVAANAGVAGSTSIQVTIPQGQRTADFVVAALENLDGVTCKIKATATNFLSDEQELDIVTPGLQIASLDSSSGTTAPPATFFVQIGVPRRNGTGLRATQAVRIGGVAVPVTACSDDVSVGFIVGHTGGCLTKSIVPGQYQVSFVFQVTGTAGSTKISVNGGGDMEMKTVRVAQTVVNLQDGPNLLGKNLQATYFVVANNNGGVTVTAHAEPSSVCVLSLDPAVAGDGLDKTVVVSPGTSRTPLVVQAVGTGDCTVTLSGGGVPTSTTTIPVVQSRLRIRALSDNISFRAPNDPFFVEIGPVNDDVSDVLSNRDNRKGITRPLPRRAGAPLTVQVCSNNPASAVIHDPINTPVPPSPPNPQCVTAAIAANESATDDFEFDPIAAGTVDVTATAPSEPDVDDTTFSVVVRTEALVLSGPDAIGKDLQQEFSAQFSKAPPSGSTVTVTATLPFCGVAINEGDAPAGQIIIPVPGGRSRADFWVQGLLEGTCTISLTTPASGFTSATEDIAIVTPAVQLRGVDSKRSSLAPNDPFRVLIGVAANNLKNLRIVQEVRPNSAGYLLPVTDGIIGIPMKVCSSDTNVGVIVGGIADNNCRKIVIEPLHESVDTLAFDPILAGMTTVSIDENGVPLIVTQAGIVKVTVTQATIGIQPEHDLGVGLQDDYNVVLSNEVAADASATILSLTPAVCYVGPDEDGPFGASTTVTIKKGRGRASFAVQGLAQGECRLSPSTTASGYSTVEASINVVAPTVRITNLDTSRALQATNDPFDVDLGIPSERLREMAQVQAARFGGGGIVVTVCSSDPTVGVIVGAGMSGCKQVTVAELSSRTPSGALEFDPVGSGTTTICASIPGYVPIPPSCRDVRVSPLVANINGHDELGSGLQDEYVLALSSAVATNTNFTITSVTPSLCKVAVNATDIATNSITVQVPAGRSRANFFVQGIEPLEGTCVLTATAPGSGIIDAYREVSIVRPAVRIINLDASRSINSPNDPFNVQIGVPNNSLRGLAFSQPTRTGGGGIVISVCSSDPPIGVIVGAAIDGCKNATIPEGEDRTPDGALEFDAVSQGTTTICVNPGGFIIATTAACKEVAVSGIAVNINGRDDLGATLQDEYVLALSNQVLADTTFTVTSNTPGECRVATSASAAAANSINVVVPKNRSKASFYVHGISIGTCELYVTAPVGISDGQREIEIVTPGLRIFNLDSSRATQSPNDPFNVEIGVPQPSLKSLSAAQARRTGGGNLPVTVCSSNPAVGVIVGAGIDGCKLVYVNEGQSRTADGVLEFDPSGVSGTTTICASAPGFISTDQACRDVTVSAIVPNINGPDTLGATLQDEYSLVLSSAVSADTAFTVTSNTPAVCRVATNRTVAGGSVVSVTVLKGRSRADLFIQGWDDTGTCNLSITTAAGGINSGQRELEVVTPGLRIVNLSSSLKTGSGSVDDNFQVEVGVPQSNLKTLARAQERRGGIAALTITACSTYPTIASIVGAGSDPSCRTATIGATATRTGSTALAVHPANPGNTTVYATAPGFISTDAASKDIIVSSGSISISGPDAIGAGLQDTFTVNLNPKAGPSGVPLTLTSLTPSLCLLAPNISTAGATTLTPPLTIGSGKSMAKIAIQALENVTGLCVIRSTTTDPAYVGEDFEVDIRQPGVRLRSLDLTTTSVSPVDSFFIDVGVPTDNLKNLRILQTIRPGAPTLPLVVQACSSATAYGVILGTATADPACKSATIPAGESSTAKDALKFQPISGTGTTTVDARATGYLVTDEGTLDVYVAATSLSINDTNLDRIGSGLMETFTIKSSGTVALDTPVTITSLTPTVCYVATSDTATSALSITATIKAGRSRQTFMIHGLEGVTGACELRATNASFADGFATFDVVQPAVRIQGLGTGKSTTSGDDQFNVDVGVPKANLANLDAHQRVRIGSSGVPITVCSSATTVGTIIGGSPVSGHPECQAVTIVAGQSETPGNTLKFHVIGGGTTTVDASAPGYIVTDAGTVDVTVSGTGLSLSIETTSTNPVGAGLQRGSYTLLRGGSTSLAAVVTVTTLTPTLCKVAPTSASAGTTSIVVTISAGNTSSTVPFWVQGMEAVQGVCELQATAMGYPSAAESITIVKPAVRIMNLAGSMANNAANDAFNVEIGVPDSALSNLVELQQARAAGPGFLISVANANSSAAQLVGSNASNVQVTGQTIIVKINPTWSTNSSGAQQRLEFDPADSLGASTGTSLEASNSDVITTTAGSVTVIVIVGGGC